MNNDGIESAPTSEIAVHSRAGEYIAIGRRYRPKQQWSHRPPMSAGEDGRRVGDAVAAEMHARTRAIHRVAAD